MQFDSLKTEQEFDRYAAEFLLKKRNPKPEHMALVLVRAYENLNGTPPSISAFERAWRELYEEKSVPLVMEKLVPPTVEKPEALTAEAYYKLPASEVIRRRNSDPLFRKQLDTLIARKEIR
jgi:hypothetical protein